MLCPDLKRVLCARGGLSLARNDRLLWREQATSGFVKDRREPERLGLGGARIGFDLRCTS